MTRSKLGTVKQIETTLQVLATFSEEREGDGQLRDAIAVVRYELGEELDRHEAWS